jgi:hypothetical protein
VHDSVILFGGKHVGDNEYISLPYIAWFLSNRDRFIIIHGDNESKYITPP